MTNPGSLQGQVALVIGAGGRFGRPIVMALAEAGADIALASATRETAEEFAINSVANELWALERRHLALTIDLDEPPTVAEAFARALRELGPLDLVVNAAVTPPDETPFLEMPAVDWQRVVQRRLGGAAAVCRAGAEAMLERGGSILNLVTPVTPLTPVKGERANAGAAAAEAAVAALTRSLALEWEGHLAVNAALVREQTPLPSLAALAALVAAAGRSLSGQVFRL